LKLSGSESEGSITFCEQKVAKKLFYSGPGAFLRTKPKAKHHASLTHFSTGAFGKIAHS
jgi:hypothetical protein